ncbi:MAG TPA: hypothetical protein VIJ29_01620 [Candidatus Paceibacterota bacterium]
MAYAVVIDKTTGSIVRKLSLSIRLEDITLSANEILSWNNEFRSAAPDFDWQSRIIELGSAVADIHCTKGCTNTVDHVDVRIEGRSAADVCALIRKVYVLLGGSLMKYDPFKEQWRRFVAWWKKFLDENDPRQREDIF